MRALLTKPRDLPEYAELLAAANGGKYVPTQILPPRPIEVSDLSDEGLIRLRMRMLADACTERHQVQPKAYTGPQMRLARFLEDAGYTVELEVPFGRYTVDIYLPERHLAFEADGEYWHDSSLVREHDRERDAYLAQAHDLPVTRMTDVEIA